MSGRPAFLRRPIGEAIAGVMVAVVVGIALAACAVHWMLCEAC